MVSGTKILLPYGSNIEFQKPFVVHKELKPIFTDFLAVCVTLLSCRVGHSVYDIANFSRRWGSEVYDTLYIIRLHLNDLLEKRKNSRKWMSR